MSQLRKLAVALGDEAIDESDDPSLTFDVIGYRGAAVASEAGWQRDVKSRGGVITRVPGGFFQDLEAARFGTAVPYAYELQPIWLLVWNGVDVASDQFLRWADYQAIAVNADNQLQALRDLLDTATGAAKGAVTAIPTAIKLAGVGLGLVVGFELLRALSSHRR
jgi:hypothetical protein